MIFICFTIVLLPDSLAPSSKILTVVLVLATYSLTLGQVKSAFYFYFHSAFVVTYYNQDVHVHFCMYINFVRHCIVSFFPWMSDRDSIHSYRDIVTESCAGAIVHAQESLASVCKFKCCCIKTAPVESHSSHE